MDDNPPPPKRVKKVAAEPSTPQPRPQEKPTFIGGFFPFTPPTPAAREPFLKTMSEAKSNAPSLGSIISIASLDDVFNCTGVCSYEAVDRVVGWIRKRRDSNPSSKFDFILPTFFINLIRRYAAVVALILLEIAAGGKPLIDLALTEEEVRVAAENYAISTLGMFKVVPPNPEF
uniref:Uncharacterized protein n=1 Tax=Brassica campestris TaxID=3711 RepID=M4F082_BRACM